MRSRWIARICQQPVSPISSGLTARRLMRRRSRRPCPFSQGASCSEGKKERGEFALGAFEDAALVALEAEEIIGAELLGEEAGALLLAMERVGRDERAFQ